MKREIRNILWLFVPCLFLLIGGAWLAQHKGAFQLDASGPLRTVITGTEVLPVTPLERWEGFQWKVVVHAKLAGSLPDLPGLTVDDRYQDLETGARLVWTNSSRRIVACCGDISYVQKEQRLLTRKRKSLLIIRDDPFPRKDPGLLTILCSPKEFPRGPGKVHLVGDVTITEPVTLQSRPWRTIPGLFIRTFGPTGSYGRTNPIPAKLDINLTDIQQSAAAVGAADTPRMETVEVFRVPPVFGIERPSSEGEINFRVRANFPPSQAGTRDITWRSGDFELRDEKGNSLKVVRDNDPTFLTMKCKDPQEWVDTYMHWNQYGKDYPPGALNLSFYTSINDGWPARHTVKIREHADWRDAVTKQLKLLSAQQAGNTVLVQVQYLGSLGVDYKSPQNEFYDTRRYSLQEKDDAPPEGRDRLILNWSQHLVTPDLGNSPTRVSPRSVAVSGNVYRITYQVDSPPVGRTGTYPFRADIGLWGKGFIPIQLPTRFPVPSSSPAKNLPRVLPRPK